MSIIIFIIKHSYHSGRNVMLDRSSVSDRIDGGARAFVCGRSGGSARLVRFSRQHITVVLTWAGTGRVDISVQLLVGFVILLHYKCRP